MELPGALKHRWAQAALVILLALWAHKKWRYSRYAAGPYPDAWQRGADEHRSYITRLADFVDLYSQGLGVDQLEERLGVHTHCGHSQAALVTYYCGRAVAGSDRSSWVAGQDADVLGVDDLIALLRMLRNASPAARARALDALVGLQAQLQAAVRVLQGKPSGYSPAAAAAASGAAQREAAAGAGGEQQQLEDAYGEEQAYDAATEEEEEEAGADEEEARHQAGGQQLRWDGRQLPQLVLRCHMDGDNVAYHTFVIASRPDLQFDVYQSFIGHYTLHDYLWSHPKPLSFEQMMQFLADVRDSQFLADVRELERATKWTRAVDSKYHSLFGVSLSRTHGYRGVRLGGGQQGADPDKYAGLLPGSWEVGRGTAMRFRWSLACGIPPANSTAMAAGKQNGAQCGEGGNGGSGSRGYSPFDFS